MENDISIEEKNSIKSLNEKKNYQDESVVFNKFYTQTHKKGQKRSNFGLNSPEKRN